MSETVSLSLKRDLVDAVQKKLKAKGVKVESLAAAIHYVCNRFIEDNCVAVKDEQKAEASQ